VIGDAAGETADQGRAVGRGGHWPHDVIARAETNRLDELGGLVIQRIQSFTRISRILACPVQDRRGRASAHGTSRPNDTPRHAMAYKGDGSVDSSFSEGRSNTVDWIYRPA
jgi:hypothetical protein